MDRQSHTDYEMSYMCQMHQTVYYPLLVLMMQKGNLKEAMADASSKINQIIPLPKEQELGDCIYSMGGHNY